MVEEKGGLHHKIQLLSRYFRDRSSEICRSRFTKQILVIRFLVAWQINGPSRRNYADIQYHYMAGMRLLVRLTIRPSTLVEHEAARPCVWYAANVCSSTRVLTPAGRGREHLTCLPRHIFYNVNESPSFRNIVGKCIKNLRQLTG